LFLPVISSCVWEAAKGLKGSPSRQPPSIVFYDNSNIKINATPMSATFYSEFHARYCTFVRKDCATD
jgi:hypothetical protein